jgi:hypothetical protein
LKPLRVYKGERTANWGKLREVVSNPKAAAWGTPCPTLGRVETGGAAMLVFLSARRGGVAFLLAIGEAVATASATMACGFIVVFLLVVFRNHANERAFGCSHSSFYR